MTSYNFQQIRENIANANSAYLNNKLAEAFSFLRSAAKISPAILNDIDALEAKYFYMLRLLVSNVNMPEITDSTLSIKEDVRSLILRLNSELEAKDGATLFSSQLRYQALRPEESLASLFSDYLTEADRLRTDTSALTDTRQKAGLERIASDIFMRLWVEYPITEENANLIESIITDESIPAYNRTMWVSAIGLSALRFDDRRIIDLLINIHSHTDDSVSTTAAIWCLASLVKHSTRAFNKNFIDSTIDRLEAAHPGDTAAVILEWTRSLGTNTQTDYINEITPHLRDMDRQIREKFENIDPEKLEEMMRNPEELSNNLDINGFDSLKRFAEAQQKGDDVFLSSLGKIRSFDFFNSLANWFLPFHTDHSALATVVDSEGAAIADTIERTPVICDSDKYALLLTMAATPANMRSMVFESMNSQLMNAYQSDELNAMLESSQIAKSRQAIINNTLKNLYRFFNLHPRKEEFGNILSKTPSEFIFASHFSPEINSELGDMLFAAREYYGATSYYSCADNLSAKQLFNMAIAFENLNDIDNACKQYIATINLKPDYDDAIMRLSNIYIDQQKFEDALTCLLRIQDAKTHDIVYLKTLGETYVHLNRWEDAVNIFYNLDYILPEDVNTFKASLAWALTVTADYDAAADVFQNAIIDASADLGHHAILLWLSDNRREALDLIKKAKELDKNFNIEDAGYKYIVANHSKGASLPLINEAMHYIDNGSIFGNII